MFPISSPEPVASHQTLTKHVAAFVADLLRPAVYCTGWVWIHTEIQKLSFRNRTLKLRRVFVQDWSFDHGHSDDAS